MIRKYAIVNNNIVTETLDLDEDLGEVSLYSSKNQLVIDIQDETPHPVVGYVLNGNKLELAQGLTDRETYEEQLNDLKSQFGIQLVKNCINKVGARNKILNKTGTQVVTLLNALIGIKFLLETGALGTARSSCAQLVLVYTEYSDILNYIIDEINIFEQNNGL